MKKIGALLCTLLAAIAVTCAIVLPASAAGTGETYVIGVYYYDAVGDPIRKDPIYGQELPEYFGGSLTHAQTVVNDIVGNAEWLHAARAEVRLLADVQTALFFSADTPVTLSLNGFTLGASGDAATLTVKAGSTLTVTDTSPDKSGRIVYTGTAVVPAIENCGRLTIQTANVKTASSAALIANRGSAARLTITGGSFDASGAGNFANDTGAYIAVSGGIFTEEVLDAFCAAGYEPLTIAADRYSVKASLYDNRFGEMLTVVGQAACDEGGTAYYPIDVVCGIDTLNYKTVGIEYRVIRTGAAPLDYTKKNDVAMVYTALNLTTAGKQSTCMPDDIGASYLYTARLLFDTKAFTEENTVIRITPYAIGTDGVTVYRGRTIELNGDICAAAGVTLFAEGD